ncbi:hypothetical protein LCGC14_1396560 [marine sediment metagenome]|uniref:Uncharacterized protein n=1 Tax=marine sediment metagenome TaxID=412755 RepID=A0A0F9KJD0_9ZZZZ
MVFKKGNIPWNKGIYGEKQNIEEIHKKQREWYHMTKDSRKSIKKDYIDRIKLTVFTHYSPKLECKCCYESEYEFLTLDHINDKIEYNHTKKSKAGWNLINWIYQNNYPLGFKILCFNCNSGRGKRNMGGICPHELKNNNDWESEL